MSPNLAAPNSNLPSQEEKHLGFVLIAACDLEALLCFNYSDTSDTRFPKQDTNHPDLEVIESCSTTEDRAFGVVRLLCKSASFHPSRSAIANYDWRKL